MRRVCVNCASFGSVSVPTQQDAPAREVHVCKLNPPTVCITSDQSGRQGAISVWPQIDGDTDFCGQWSELHVKLA